MKIHAMFPWRLAILATVTLGLGQSPCISQIPPMNVLFIAVDDLRPELGCYGHSNIHSPNIDSLARRGMLFERAYCQQAVCNPSRSSLMTGMRPDSLGVTGNHLHFRSNHPNVVTLPQHFKQHGYQSEAIGKIFHGVFPDGSSKTKWDTMGDPASWSVPAIRFGPRYYYTEEGIAAAKLAYQQMYKPQNPGADDWTDKLVFGPATESPDVADNALYDGKVAEAAVNRLQQLATTAKPFFLAVGFIKPHSPYIAPKKYFDLYNDVAMPSDIQFPTDAPSYAGHGSAELRRYTDQPKRGPISDQTQLRIRHAYYACISYIDAQIGRVLAALDQTGLSENTIVVLFGDHGYHLGEQGLWGKTTNYELDTRVPLIVLAPGMRAAGKSTSSLVELVDLYPTLCELAELPVSKQLESNSFAPILDDPTHLTKQVALSQYPRGGGLMGYSIRTPTHRLTQWMHRQSGVFHETELYDYSAGLVETRNIAASAPALVSKLLPRLMSSFGISFLASHKPQVTPDQPDVESKVGQTSFENAKSGQFDEVKNGVGTWRSEAGKCIIDNKHAKTGRHCLQLTGGEKSTVTLDISDNVDVTGDLTFAAERWTSRSPFSFRIEKRTEAGWSELFNGDRTIRVGRPFLSNVKIPLGDVPISQLRFSVTSPPGTGILIDDVRIAPAVPQKIVSAEIVPLTLPALVGTDSSPLLKLKIETIGSRNPISLTEVKAAILSEVGDVVSAQAFWTAGTDQFTNTIPFGQVDRLADSEQQQDAGREPGKKGTVQTTDVAFTGNQTLQEGKNYIWIACELAKDADISQQVGAMCREVTFSDGVTLDVESKPQFQRLGIALRQGGDDGVHTFRIPGLATTNRGTLIGVYDVRHRSGGDLPGDIDVGMSRSCDGGRTWEPMKVIMDMGDNRRWNHDGIGDPAVLVDQNTGTIWVAATWSHGNRSWVGSGPGLTPDETGQLMLVRSDDDGITWSAPINITNQVKKPEWCFILQGPGKGITMRDGTIVFAAQYQDPPEKRRLPHSTIIYSKDHGKTWHAGTGAFDDTTEAQVVETEPGVLMLNCRYNRKSVRVVMTTRNMGQTWQKHPTSERALIEPGACMASLIDVDREVGKDIGGWLLFSNPDSLRGRNHITIKASPDRGQTWPKEHRLLLDDDSSAGYSCMSMIDEKTVGVLYEGSQAHMTFQRIPLSDVLENSDAKTSARDQNRPLDVFVLTGQSNSLGTVNPRDARDPNPPASSSDTRVPFFWSNRSTRAGDSKAALIGDSRGRFVPLRPQQGEGSNPVFWGPEFGFARTLSKAGHTNFAIIKASRGGGGNSFWLKGSRDDHMYHHVVTTVADAIKALPKGRDFRIRAVLYVQGESDNAEEAARAGERIETLLKNLRADLPQASEARLLVGGIAAAGGHKNRVREQQKDAAGRNESIEYVDNSDLASHLYDRLHFDRPAKLTVGERLARKWLAIKPSKRTARATGGPVLRIACVGDSITYGAGIKDRATQSYPAQLQRLLGDRYEVRNFGVSGSGVLKEARRSNGWRRWYISKPEYQASRDFHPDVVVINLGINDIVHWKDLGRNFSGEYVELIESYQILPSQPRVFVWHRLAPLFPDHAYAGSPDLVDLNRAIAAAATQTGVPTIDLETPLVKHPEWFPDRIHPNSAGAGKIAEEVAAAIAEHTVLNGGHSRPRLLSAVFSDHMVLQTGMPIPVWGRAPPGATVLVRLGSDRRKVVADGDGAWQVRWPARPVSREPTTLSVQCRDERRTVKDILVGEVWICAGQSNMEWPLQQSTHGAAELAAADHPNIRLLHLAPEAGGGSGSYTSQQLSRLTPDSFCQGRWRVASPESARNFSAVGWYFGHLLEQELNVPIGLICPAVGGTPTEAWIPRDALEADPGLKGLVAGNWLDNDRLGDFCRTRGEQNLLSAMQAGENIPGDGLGPNHSFKPGFMWSAGIQPLIPFAIRGTIWYQGESNAETPARVREHGLLFPLLIHQWRKRWGQGDFPFLYVQLPALNRPEWPSFRDGQRRALGKLSHVGMAVTIDTGHPSNVHPRLKKPVGQRLASWALATTYGLQGSHSPSGPLFEFVQRQGNTLVVSFRHVGDGLKSLDKQPIRHFEVCGRDGIFQPATATIIGPHNVAVSSSIVADPHDARYAWSPYPDPSVNLVNSDELPASPFSTESEEAVFARSVQVERTATDDDQRPNILIIVSEDNGPELGCYGDKHARTPNLDQLAAEGVRFETAYVTQSVCSSSRSTIFTGLYPHQNGQIGLATHNFEMFRAWPTTYSLLKAAGYRTGLIGKTHVNPSSVIESHVDFRRIPSSNFSKKDLDAYAKESAAFINDSEKPFFLTVNFPDAHWPVQDQVQGRPKTVTAPEIAGPLPYIGFDNKRLRGHLSGFYNCMARLDECVGELINELAKSGKADNTLVIYIGDHGAQFARGKVFVTEGGLRIPFVVRWPGKAKRGLVSQQLVSTIDLLPTIVAAAGIQKPDYLPGKDLAAVLNGQPKTLRDYLFAERNCDSADLHFPQRAIRDSRYKLIKTLLTDRPDPGAHKCLINGASNFRGSPTYEELKTADQRTQTAYATWLNPPEYQLYDLQNDRHEFTNVTDDPTLAEVKTRLINRLSQWQHETDDKLRIPEMLEHLTQEIDDCREQRLRSPPGGWEYTKYLAPAITD